MESVVLERTASSQPGSGRSLADRHAANRQELDRDVGVDPIEEIRLRTWARFHYRPETERDDRWHPVVLDEMSRRDAEMSC